MGNSYLQGGLFRSLSLKFALRNSRTISLNWHSNIEIGTRAILPDGQVGIVVDAYVSQGEVSNILFPDPGPITTLEHLRAFKTTCSTLGLLPWKTLYDLLPATFGQYEKERLEVGKSSSLDKKSMEVINLLSGRSLSARTLKSKLGDAHLKRLISLGILKKVKSEPYRAREFSPTSHPRVKISKRLEELLDLLSALGKATLSELNLRGFNANQLNALLRRGLVEELSINPAGFKPLRSKFEKNVYCATFKSIFERIYSLCNSVSGSLLILSQDRDLLFDLSDYLINRISKNIICLFKDDKPENLYSNYFSAQSKNCIILSEDFGLLLPAFSLQAIVLLGSFREYFPILFAQNLCREISLPLYSFDISTRLFFIKDAKETQIQEPNLLVLQRNPKEILTKKARELLERDLNQRVLFLVSKSGYSYGYCKSCNTLVHCPVCQSLLTLDKNLSKAYCTSCGYTSGAFCPECNQRLVPSGFGIDRLKEEVMALFPASEGFEFHTVPPQREEYDLVIVTSADPILSVPRFNSFFNYLDYILRASRVSKGLTLVQTSDISNPLLKESKLAEIFKKLLYEREKKSLPPFQALIETSCNVDVPSQVNLVAQNDKLYITVPTSYLAEVIKSVSKYGGFELFLD
ncbi:MAG: hypothetical protein ABDH18_06180 [Aquificaceae bacterium]